MAENAKKFNTENTQKGAPRPHKNNNRGGKGKRGKQGGRYADIKAESSVFDDELSSGLDEAAPRKQKPSRKNERRPRGEHKSKNERKSPSPRITLMQERQTAEQKAFAEAKDILLEAEKQKTEVPKETEEAPKVEIVGVRFKQSGRIYYFAPGSEKFEMGDGVIVETARGREYGYIALTNRMVSESDTVHPLREIIRKATAEDGEKNRLNKLQEKRAADVWKTLVEKHKLVMHLTDVEYTFDNSKLVFYFTADGRVDFRDLVKDLASVFRTRIELRQIGVRDEAKLLGGLGVCGMPFCCHRFLPDFVQVSIKMAKEQSLSLSSSKISGNCGRLMCCLRYEQDVYDREYETFPSRDMVVRTAVGTGIVAESNFISGNIKVRMDGDGTAVFKNFKRDEVKVIGRGKSTDNDQLDKELKELED